MLEEFGYTALANVGANGASTHNNGGGPQPQTHRKDYRSFF